MAPHLGLSDIPWGWDSVTHYQAESSLEGAGKPWGVGAQGTVPAHPALTGDPCLQGVVCLLRRMFTGYPIATKQPSAEKHSDHANVLASLITRFP